MKYLQDPVNKYLSLNGVHFQSTYKNPPRYIQDFETYTMKKD